MADSSKKRKMSKADKEKMKKEEQERKAQEEEAARIKAIEEAKKQQKVQAAQAIEKAKQENEERRCRREDMTELEQMLNASRQQLLETSHNRRVQAKWARFMRCDGSPDPVNQGEINTYINLRLEDNTRDDAESVLKDSELTLGLIEELQFILSDTPPEELPEKTKNLYQETVTELENLISHKLDLATLQLLCDATTMANSETGNLQHTIQNDQISLCVWGNLVKNTRIRSFEYPNMHFTFDIPRALTLSDCAVALLSTKFDHLSPYSKSAIPRRKKKEEEELEPEQTTEQKEDQEETEEKEGEQENAEAEDGDEEKAEEKEETEIPVKPKAQPDLMAALRGEDPEEETKEEEPEEEAYEEDFSYPPTPEPTEWEDFEEDDDIVDLRANDVLGGVFKLCLLQMPPQPKTLGKWTITQLVVPPELHPMDYVAEAPPQNAEGVKETKDNKDKKDEKTPIQITTVLPKDVMFLEEPIVARWVKKKNMWSTEGFFEFNYNEEARTFSFKTLQFGTMCFLQDSHINMPFQSWEIRPHKVNSCLFTIIAAIVEIEIEIKDALCCLSQPQDRPELDSIRNKWVTPSELIVMLKRAGVNVFPNEDSSKYVNIQNKHPIIEQNMYQQMALTASAMAYSWSKWNGQTEREHVVFQGAEALEDEPLLEEDWSVFMATKQRVMKLKMTEFDDSFSQDPFDQDIAGRSGSKLKSKRLSQMKKYSGPSSSSIRSRCGLKKSSKAHLASKKIEEMKDPNDMQIFEVFNFEKSEFKSNIYHLMMAYGTDTAKDRIKDTNYQFVDCVHQLLKATQVLTYA